jgi:hypothetical protein
VCACQHLVLLECHLVTQAFCLQIMQGVLENQLAPLAFLYLLHPHPPTAAAAHNLLCSLLVAVPQPQRPPLAAYYVQRCLEGCPGTTSATQLAQVCSWSTRSWPGKAYVVSLSSCCSRCRHCKYIGCATLFPWQDVGVRCFSHRLCRGWQLSWRCCL